jgi:uncharacterized membrane protein YkgB
VEREMVDRPKDINKESCQLSKVCMVKKYLGAAVHVDDFLVLIGLLLSLEQELTGLILALLFAIYTIAEVFILQKNL